MPVPNTEDITQPVIYDKSAGEKTETVFEILTMKLVRTALERQKPVLSVIILLILITIPSLAQPSAKKVLGADFTLESVMEAPFPSQLVAARRSSRIAWVFNHRGERNVWTAEGPDYKAHAVTHYSGDDGQEIHALSITADGTKIIFVRGSETDPYGYSANPASLLRAPEEEVWVIDVRGGEPRLLGPTRCTYEGCEQVAISPDGERVVWAGRQKLWLASLTSDSAPVTLAEVRGDIGQQQWSPDGKLIAACLDRGDHSFVVVIDVNTREVHYVGPSTARDQLPRWSPDGRSLAFVRIAGQESGQELIPEPRIRWSIALVDTASFTVRQLWTSPDDRRGTLPFFWAEGFQFVTNGLITLFSEHSGHNHLYSIGTGSGNSTELTAGDFDVEEVTPGADGTTLIYSSNQGDIDRRHLWRVNVSGGHPPQEISRGDTIEWAPIETGGKDLFCLGSSATLPAQVFLLKTGNRTAIAGDTLPAGFPSAQLTIPRSITYKTRDGWEIHGQLFQREGTGKEAPALLFLHGGPQRQMLLGFHNTEYYHRCYSAMQYLASRGYVVLSINYRLSTMYGFDFYDPPNSGWRGASEYTDIVEAAKYLKSLPGVDGAHIGVWGGSYGGYLTELALARNSDTFTAGVAINGVDDMRLLLNRLGDVAKAPDFKQAEVLAISSSPIAAIDKWRSPVLLIHGDDDRHVPFGQTVDLAEKLSRRGVEVEELVFPNESHAFLLWRTVMACFQNTSDFFDRKLKGK